MNDATGRMDTRMEPVTIHSDDRPDRLNNVRTSRVLAFLVDAALILLLMGIAAVVISFLGLITFGIGWLLFFILWPAVALLYYFFTLGLNGATPGMNMFSVELRDLDGNSPHPVIGIAHPVFFWFSVGITPLYLASLVVSLLDEKKRMLHDIVLRTVMVRTR
jgi:uncharacterized RDD family membrane protein YckC